MADGTDGTDGTYGSYMSHPSHPSRSLASRLLRRQRLAPRRGHTMIDRILSSLVALSLAFLVWLYARSRDQEILDNVVLPVQITLAEADADRYSLELNGPAQGSSSTFDGPE